ncbi:hypothetical protein ACH4ZU_20280 [Streptomyces sp. NPDC020472]|uniref:hypothetical protein n=1 Tax=Streptomyces sp. NPDC020472 TaxID=3365075 RepID=UPI0037A62FFE
MAGAIVAGRIDHLHQHFSGSRRTARLDRSRPIEQWTAQQLGVHPAIHGTDEPDTDGVFVLPGYVEREHDHRLRAHLLDTARGEQAVLVLVRGVSCSGKTRTALEAVRTCLPRWNLVFPKTAEGLLALLEVGGPAPRTVLWLNEAQNHLRGTAGEEAAAALQSRLEKPGPIVVLGMLWPEYYRGFTTTPRPGGVTNDDEHAEHRNARGLLAQAVLVDVPASFTSEALKDPLLNRDPSLAAAVRSSTGGRILQTLAAGPQLVDHYQQATEPHGPYGHAVITAAMDARRLGHASPLPAALLEAAAPGYLTERQRADADPDTWFAHALAYAREKIKAVTAALEPVADPDGMGPAPGLFHLNDYLDHHARTTRRYALPPASFWTAVRDHAAGAPDLDAVAQQAMWRLRFRIAADLYQRAADAGDPMALQALGKRYEEVGDAAGAERFWQRAADAGFVEALLEMTARYREAGDLAGAEGFARRLADAGMPSALTEWGQVHWAYGDVEAAERLFQYAADARDREALSLLMLLREESGDTAGALLLAQRAADAGDRSLLRELAIHRDTPWSAVSAEPLWQQIADAGDPSALVRLGWLRKQAGDTVGAERLWQLAADAGDLEALSELGRQRGQTDVMSVVDRARRFGLEADGSLAAPW